MKRDSQLVTRALCLALVVVAGAGMLLLRAGSKKRIIERVPSIVDAKKVECEFQTLINGPKGELRLPAVKIAVGEVVEE